MTETTHEEPIEFMTLQESLDFAIEVIESGRVEIGKRIVKLVKRTTLEKHMKMPADKQAVIKHIQGEINREEMEAENPGDKTA